MRIHMPTKPTRPNPRERAALVQGFANQLGVPVEGVQPEPALMPTRDYFEQKAADRVAAADRASAGLATDREVIVMLLNAAVPNERDHPCMWRAWRAAEAHLARSPHAAAIEADVRARRRSSEIQLEIIQKVGMMASARTPEMQARYDAAVERESNHGPTCDFRDGHDPATDFPTGARCGSRATHRIEWEDGRRYSYGCAMHLEIEDAATVKPYRIVPITEGK